MAGVQPALRPPIRVDLDQPQNETMVCRACGLNFVQVFCRRTLAWIPTVLEFANKYLQILYKCNFDDVSFPLYTMPG